MVLNPACGINLQYLVCGLCHEHHTAFDLMKSLHEYHLINIAVFMVSEQPYEIIVFKPPHVIFQFMVLSLISLYCSIIPTVVKTLL